MTSPLTRSLQHWPTPHGTTLSNKRSLVMPRHTSRCSHAPPAILSGQPIAGARHERRRPSDDLPERLQTLRLCRRRGPPDLSVASDGDAGDLSDQVFTQPGRHQPQSRAAWCGPHPDIDDDRRHARGVRARGRNDHRRGPRCAVYMGGRGRDQPRGQYRVGGALYVGRHVQHPMRSRRVPPDHMVSRPTRCDVRVHGPH